MGLLLALIWWVFTALLILVIDDFELQKTIIFSRLLLLPFIYPMSILSLSQSLNTIKWIERPFALFLLLCIPFTVFFVALIPSFHSYLFVDFQSIEILGIKTISFKHGPIAKLYFNYSAIAGIFLLSNWIYQSIRSTSKLVRKQALLILLASACIMSLDFIGIRWGLASRWLQLPAVFLSLVAFAFSYIILRFDYMNIATRGRDQLFDLIPFYIWIVNSDGLILDFNLQASELMKLKTTGLLLSDTINDPELKKRLQDKRSGDFKLKIKNNIRFIDLQFKEMLDIYKENIGMLIIAKDVTILAEKNELLSEASDFKVKLLALLSHDIVGNLRGHEIVLDEINSNYDSLSTNKKKDLLAKIQLSVDESIETISQLVVWSKSQLESFKPVKKDIDLVMLVRDCILKVAVLSSSRDIKINLLSESKDEIVNIDQEMVSSIIRNILINAIKASKTNGAVAISIQKNNSMAYINISDSGNSLGYDQNSAGFGMGRYICTQIASAHNIKILDSELKPAGRNVCINIPTELAY